MNRPERVAEVLRLQVKAVHRQGRVLVDGHHEVPNLGGQVVHVRPLLHGRGAFEQALDHGGIAPILRRRPQRF
eukprot:6692376-Prorocentrum_lima.AAC.1